MYFWYFWYFCFFCKNISLPQILQFDLQKLRIVKYKQTLQSKNKQIQKIDEQTALISQIISIDCSRMMTISTISMMILPIDPILAVVLVSKSALFSQYSVSRNCPRLSKAPFQPLLRSLLGHNIMEPSRKCCYIKTFAFCL